MTDECELRNAGGTPGLPCEKESCVFWRVVGHLGVCENGTGCAIQHFELLDDGPEMVAWLLSVKERLEGQLPD